MKLDLNRLLDGGEGPERADAAVDLSGYAAGGEHPFSAPVAVVAAAENRVGVVSLVCGYRYTLSLRCGRCLAPVVREEATTVSHTVVRSLQNGDAGEDDEYLVAPDGLVELDELVANDLIPELPARVLCREDCKGLCPVCGGDRNQTQCGCEEHQPDPRLAALDKFFE